MYVKNKITSYSGLGKHYGQADTPNQMIENALPISVSIDAKEVRELPPVEKKPKIYNASHFIPKQNPIFGWMGARKYLQRPVGSAPQVAPLPKMKGGVFWTTGGPKFSQTNVIGGAKAESVPAPETVWKPSIAVVRDKPKIDLPAIEIPSAADFAGLGELSTTIKIGLPVLCLLVGIFLLYRK